MAEAIEPRHNVVVEHTVNDPKLNLSVRGCYDSMPPACLIIRSQDGPIFFEK